MGFFRVSLRSLVVVSVLGVAVLPLMTAASPYAIASPEVSKLAVAAADAAFNGRFSEAGDLAQRSGDPAAIKLVELIYLRDHWKTAGYRRIMDFVDAAPGWPFSETFLKRAERSLFDNQAAAGSVLAHFATHAAMSAEGKLALARAELDRGDKPAARRLVSQVWIEETLDQTLEGKIRNEFGSLLTSEDYRLRMWRLIYKQETNAALRASKALSKDYQAAAAAAQALIRSVGGAEKKYGALSSTMRQQLGVQYALARYYRKLERDSKARAILASVPGDPDVIGDPEAWWVERRIIARRSLGTNSRDNWKLAYDMARKHGFTSGEYFGEGEFLAGWIALRFLNQPNTAIHHFSRLSEGADSRTDKARADYWLGRSYAAVGNMPKAKEAWRAAARTPTVYYGQLAREQLGLAREPMTIASGQPSAAASAKIDNDEVMRAFEIVAKTGRARELNTFLWAIANRFKSTDEMNAAASVAYDAGGPAVAVRLAKLAGRKGYDIDYWGYPVKAIPSWKQIGKPIERALVFALSRQESEFDPNAGSGAGARGLMQLMPGTAKLIARQYKVSYAPDKLTSDPSYNVKLGAAHLGDLIDEFGGSYVLTLAAYNAGPRRAKEWVQTYGDPRSGKVDPIDWVEMIPFTETRNYVQKVMQNVQVYRSRLAPDTMRAMSADLRRGAPGAIALADTAEPGTANCSVRASSIAELISGCD
jgi:soluble lytic murein transglycosylase